MCSPNICGKSCQIFVTLGQIFVTISIGVIFRKYLALAQAQMRLTLVLIPHTSGRLFHTNLGWAYLLPQTFGSPIHLSNARITECQGKAVKAVTSPLTACLSNQVLDTNEEIKSKIIHIKNGCAK